MTSVPPENEVRRVIEISGDGPNNQGRPVTLARDAALAEGIVINGLPLMTREGMGFQRHLDDLDAWYRDCVIGGPGTFVIPVLEWTHFREACAASWCWKSPAHRRPRQPGPSRPTGRPMTA